MATWQVGVRGVGLVGSERQLALLSVSDFLVNFVNLFNFLLVCSFSLHFKKLNNVCLQEEFI
jgi:hypothetical protein